MTVIQGESEKRYSFWADAKDQEVDIFDQFLAHVSQYHDFRVFCYGGYERAFLKRMRASASRKKPVDRILDGLVNVLSLIFAHVYFPCHSNGLKDVSGCLGFAWTDPDASGIQSIVWRKRWEIDGNDSWRQKLVTYNQEDCAALRKLTEFLCEVGSRPVEARDPLTTRTCSVSVSSVEELDRLVAVNRRGSIEFFHPDFKFVNLCAHFDYQRQRVFIRTSKLLKRNRRKPKKNRNRKLRVSQMVNIVSRKCPTCGSKEIIRWPKGKPGIGNSTRHKKAFDLVLGSGGIKRRVIECRTSIHQCVQCAKIFVPDRYQRLAKHFHGLMSWAMYEHVAHRISHSTLQEMFRDIFGLAVHHTESFRFKSIMANYYRPCFDSLLKKILSSMVLHVDETEIKLRSGKGYVWVFTTTEEVIYLYRPTREGDFLPGLLKNFHGVLVSDFYAAYDSLPFPQQKCLIHLMRDMNQNLLENPFDVELQSITKPFGVILRSVVEDVDRHGLRSRYLRKHECEARKFFGSLETQSFSSEVADALRTRLLKYREKLFAFLSYDGVPWNNNNAENAIRRFAYYRDITAGLLKEAGLREHLILLSIYQTCHYKGISFLKFLLSRERDVEAFCRGRLRRRRTSLIEVYPKGQERPDFGPSSMRRRSKEPPPNPS